MLGTLKDWEIDQDIVCVLTQASRARRWSGQSAASSSDCETAPGGHIFLGSPKIICATVVSKVRPTLSPVVPGCRDGGLHKTSATTSQSGLDAYLFIHASVPLFHV